MKIYEVRYQNETIVAYDNYLDALSKKEQLHNTFLDDNYSVVCVEKESIEK